MFGGDILAIDIARFLQSLIERGHISGGHSCVIEKSNGRHCLRLRHRCKRPNSRRTAKQREEFSTFHVPPAKDVVQWLKPSTLRPGGEYEKAHNCLSRRDADVARSAVGVDTSKPATRRLPTRRPNSPTEPIYCGAYVSRLLFAILTTDSATLRSSFKNSANAAGVVAADTTPRLSRNSTNFGSLNSLTNSALILLTIAGGVPFGATIPHQPWPG